MPFRDEFTFLEKPASRDEKLIGDLMRKYFEALKNHDVGLLVSLFSEDARIESKAAGGIVSRKEYAQAIESVLSDMSPIHIKELRISVENNTADVYGVSSYGFRGRLGRRWLRKWKFGKKDDTWLIVESHYYPLN